MQPLVFMEPGSTATIRRVSGADETRRFLAGLGFVEDGKIQVVSRFSGNMIVNVKDSRVALNKDMARHIMV